MFTDCVCHGTVLCSMQPKCPTQAVQHRQDVLMLLWFVMWHAAPGLLQAAQLLLQRKSENLWPGQVCWIRVVQIMHQGFAVCASTTDRADFGLCIYVTGQQPVHLCSC